jgi:tyrosyl-DNA phosphodiesterase-1
LGPGEKVLKEITRSLRALQHCPTLTEDVDGEQYSKEKTAKSGGSKKALKEDLLEDVNVIWPSVAMIGQSVNGYDSGAVIICQAKTIRQEDAAKKMLLPNAYKPTIEQVMRKWQGEPGHKERRAPHIKTFYRYFISVEDGRPELCWLYLGSHNLSMAAWGTLEINNTQLYCKNYELGVLYLPSQVKATTRDFSLTPNHRLLGCTTSSVSAAAFSPLLPPRFFVSHEPSPLDGSCCHFPLPHRCPAPAYFWRLGGLENTPWSSDLDITTPDCCGKKKSGKIKDEGDNLLMNG